MLGGAFSLLLGFDIVMTERGAAMTIGGVVALSGGVIALGIGLALVRLNQLLRMLEARAAKPVRAGGTDRPVVPIAAEDIRPPVATPEPAAPPHPRQPTPAGDLLHPTMASAGLAGAAALGAAAAGRARLEEEVPLAREPLPGDRFPPTSPVSDAPSPPAAPSSSIGVSDLLPARTAAVGLPPEVLSRDDLPPEDLPPEDSSPENLPLERMPPDRLPREEFSRDENLRQDLPREDLRGDLAETPALPASSIALPLDLEEELTRALAETSLPPDLPASPTVDVPPAEDRSFAPAESAAEDRSFEDGLSKLLGRPVRPAAVPIESPPLQQDLADMLAPISPSSSAAELAEREGDPTSFAGERPSGFVAEDMPAPLHQPIEPAPAAETSADREDGLGEESSSANAFGERDQTPEVDRHGDDDLFDDPSPPQPEGERDGGAEPSMAREEAAPAPESPPSAPVLGTYTIGGRTYRMFGDGSVEAVSEGGAIERFASMDELRKHLARA
jgi:hypothetical protein